MRLPFIFISVFIPLASLCQYNHPFDYCTRVLNASGNPVSMKKVVADVSVADKDSVLYREEHTLLTDPSGKLCFQLGRGTALRGKFDSLIWSVGSFYLINEFRDKPGGNIIYRERHLMREPEKLAAQHEQGTFEFREGSGIFTFSHKYDRRPRRMQLDLVTSYINRAYPADTYPLYLHLEWVDEDRDGKGTAFAVSYSQNARNSFATSTGRLGAVSLYSANFQEITAESDKDLIKIELSPPKPIDIYSNTYAMKGSCTMIYYFEW